MKVGAYSFAHVHEIDGALLIVFIGFSTHGNVYVSPVDSLPRFKANSKRLGIFE